MQNTTAPASFQNTTFLHANATNTGNGEICLLLNVSTTGGSEASAIACFKAASRTYHLREIGEAYQPETHEIRLLASRPATETQRIINAIKRYGAKDKAGVIVCVLRKNAYNRSDSKLEGLYCPDTLRAIRSLVKETRGW